MIGPEASSNDVLGLFALAARAALCCFFPPIFSAIQEARTSDSNMIASESAA